jgi:putative membrane protein
MDKLN